MTSAAQIADVLSGASLLMAVLAALFAIWQPDITKALQATVKLDPANRGPERALVSSALWRVIPLLIVTAAAIALLGPRCLSIACVTVACAIGYAGRDGCRLDEAAGLLFLTEVLLVILVVAISRQAGALIQKRKALKP